MLSRWWRRQGSVARVAGCLAAVTLAACSMLFDQGPLPPTRRLRSSLVQDIEELKRKIGEGKAKEAPAAGTEAGPSARVPPPIEKAETWEKAAELLPKDKAGHIDWVKALEAGTVAPRPGVNPRAPDRMIMDLEVDLASARSKLFSVSFGHESHTEWLSCKNCHAKIFPLKRGAPPAVVTMARIKEGRYCGACHSDASVAFGIKDECARCHAKIPAQAKWRPSEEPKKPIERAKSWEEAAKLLPLIDGAPDWAKAMADGVIAPRWGIDPKAEDEDVLPSDVELEPAENSPGKVTFSHESHTAILTCTNCHREMEKSDKKTVFIGTHDDCEICHGPVAFNMDTCDRCHKEAEEGK